MTVKRYVCYPRSNKTEMLELTQQRLASSGYWNELTRYVLEADYNLLADHCTSVYRSADEWRRAFENLQAENERLREKLAELEANARTAAV